VQRIESTLGQGDVQGPVLPRRARCHVRLHLDKYLLVKYLSKIGRGRGGGNTH
jgi:hypothetical protein